MTEYDFTHVEAAIIDTQTNTLRVLRDVVARLGVKNIELFDSIGQAGVLLTGGFPDLVLVDCQGPHEAEAFRFIRAFRNEPETPNPFAVIIVTTWQPTPVQLLRVTNSGADDLLVKPVSPKQVQERLVALIEARKKFVVTADYIGPDRRKAPREGAQVPLVDAPNTLRMKATGRFLTHIPKEEIKAAQAIVQEQKRLRCSIQAAFLIEFATPGLIQASVEKTALDHFLRVGGVVDDLLRRLSEGGAHDAAERAGHALKAIVERVRKGGEAGHIDANDLKLAHNVAETLMQAVDPERPLDSMWREVNNAVAAYRARLEQMVQAKAAEAARVVAAAAPPTTDG